MPAVLTSIKDVLTDVYPLRRGFPFRPLGRLGPPLAELCTKEGLLHSLDTLSLAWP